MEITKFQKLLLRKICKKIVRQGCYPENNIVEYYRIMLEAAEKEFTEDNIPTLQGFLANCFFESTGKEIDTDPGFLQSYYILKEILERKELLPLLLGISPELDKKIDMRLKDG